MIVVKAGGNTGVDFDTICGDVAALVHEKQPVVLVHGGSDETNRVSEQLGHPPRFVTSESGYVSRYTDRQTLEIFAMVTAGSINKRLVEHLQQAGVNALGLSGLDGRLVQARRKPALRIVENGKRKVLRGDHSGRIESVNAPLLETLLAGGYTPVVAPLAASRAGTALNVDADRVAAALAGGLHAHTLVLLTNVPGLLRDPQDESSLIAHVPAGQAQAHLDRYAKGRMKKKLLGAIEALGDGVQRVVIGDGRVERPLRRALEGAGTVLE